MIDRDGYRPNVGVILSNAEGRVLWAQRRGREGWQFPQGGIRSNETPEQALFRELYEEVGLAQSDVRVLGRTGAWLYYDVPPRSPAARRGRPFRGQKQLWFLLRLVAGDEQVRLDCTDRPEFESWRWVDYWTPIDEIVAFKREVYIRALSELEPLLFNVELAGPPPASYG
jgi:putative (di)nucleoside polyphosphate hydrolase